MTGIPFHPYSNAFPLMDGLEFTEFVDDIKAHGQREPITIYQGQILEGRNRYRACLRLKIEPTFEEFKGGDAEAHAFVISRNVHRRHLKPKDKRDAIAKLLKLQPEKSDRQIAEVVKASPTTVGAVRAEMESTVQIGQLPKRGAPTARRASGQPPTSTASASQSSTAGRTPPLRRSGRSAALVRAGRRGTPRPPPKPSVWPARCSRSTAISRPRSTDFCTRAARAASWRRWTTP